MVINVGGLMGGARSELIGEFVQQSMYWVRGNITGQCTSSKPYHIACVRRAPKSLFGEVLLAHTDLSHKPPTFRLGTTGYAGSPKPLKGTFRTLEPSVGITST
ncbi:hypothetical protein PIB30_082093 [Stylosanthes scabra]|uniref:Uncharacterized protein n=1 Tax=Stylosanthes scabra TaxID=79078 RepID=A0ABU6UTM4_9FABA|nr:hypothetical protein [Stylosanthes scabra]